MCRGLAWLLLPVTLSAGGLLSVASPGELPHGRSPNPGQGAKHCRNLTPGGHLNLARTGHFYLALIATVRIMYIMVNTI